MNEWPILALIFTATTAVAFLLMSIVNLWNREEDATSDEPAPRIFGPFTPLVAGLLPQSVSSRDSTRKALLRAGYYEPVALVNFQALRSVLTYLPLIAGEVGAILTSGPISVIFFGIGLVAGVLGFAVPRVILAIQADRRSEHIRRGLPMLMDTMGLTLSTGSSLQAAFAASGEAIRRGHPELAHEVRVVSAHAPMRSLSHALDQWKDRQPIPELGSLVFLLSQADRFGTDITAGLWELSTSLQINGRQRAEAAANKANFYMLFPTVLCLLIAAGLMLAGPGIVALVDSNRQVEEYIRAAREQEIRLKEEAMNNGTMARPTLEAKPIPAAP